MERINWHITCFFGKSSTNQYLKATDGHMDSTQKMKFPMKFSKSPLMFICYVDESGDTGTSGNSPTQYFCLSALIFHEIEWNTTLELMIQFRKDLRNRFGIKLREEIHASQWLNKPGNMIRIPKYQRLHILREVLDFQRTLPNVNIINVVVDKHSKSMEYDVFENAWKVLLQRFHNTISNRNFPGPQNTKDCGLIICDNTDEKRLRNLSRKMRKYNPIPHRGGVGYRQLHIDTFVEDPVHRNSIHSFPIQMCDVNAFFLYQKYSPSSFVKKKGGKNYLFRLEPILCKVATSSNLQGIVEI